MKRSGRACASALVIGISVLATGCSSSSTAGTSSALASSSAGSALTATPVPSAAAGTGSAGSSAPAGSTTASAATAGASGQSSGSAGSSAPPESGSGMGDTTAAPISPPVTLTMWGTYGNGGNTAQTDILTKTLIPKFEQLNPGVTVNYVDIPYDSLKQKLTTGAAGGQLPDVVRSDIGWVAQFAKLGVFAQLDDNMPAWASLSKAVYPGTLATNLWNGHYYGLPLDTNTRVLITSDDALKAAGRTEPPKTFDDLKAMADKLKGTKVQLFADGGLQGWNILPWIWSGGGEITDPKLTKSTGYLDSDKNVATVQMLVDLYNAKQIPNLITGNQGATSTSDGLPTGKYATIFDGPWMRDIWKGQYPKFSPVYAPIPAGDGGSVSVVGGEDIVMTKSSQHQDAAKAFLAFTQSKDFQLDMAKSGQMTVVSAYGGQEVSADPYLKVFAAQLATAKPRLAIPDSGQVDTILQNALTPAFQGQTSVKAALTSAAKQIDPLLAAGS